LSGCRIFHGSQDLWVNTMLMGTIRGGSGGNEGKTPIRDESLNNHDPTILGFEKELLINGMVDSVLVLRSNVQRSN
jgi:hypothetical protein